jgi:hypothetical protein
VEYLGEADEGARLTFAITALAVPEMAYASALAGRRGRLCRDHREPVHGGGDPRGPTAGVAFLSPRWEAFRKLCAEHTTQSIVFLKFHVSSLLHASSFGAPSGQLVPLGSAKED